MKVCFITEYNIVLGLLGQNKEPASEISKSWSSNLCDWSRTVRDAGCHEKYDTHINDDEKRRKMLLF